MGRAVRILLGQQFGRLRVVERARNRAGIVYWWCECYCGRSLSVRATSLANGSTRSCGCLRSEASRDRARKRAVAGANATRQARDKVLDAIFAPARKDDPVHVDRSGARVIRGRRY